MEDKMKNLEEIAEKVKGVESDVNNLIVPLLKDTIKDGNRDKQRLFVSNIILIIAMLITIIFSLLLVAYQNQKYAEFLSQFEFESEEVYQDLDSADGGNSIINDGITITK